MPIENGVGYGDHTQQKQDDFRSMLSLHINIVDGITQRPGNAWQDLPELWQHQHVVTGRRPVSLF